MKLLPTQIDDASLTSLGEEARTLLLERDYVGLANSFGYALAYGRTPAAAIEADFISAAKSPITVGTDGCLLHPITVTYFSPNDTALFAVVNCPVPVAGNSVVLLELVVAGSDQEKNITLEEISGVTN